MIQDQTFWILHLGDGFCFIPFKSVEFLPGMHLSYLDQSEYRATMALDIIKPHY